MVSKPLAWARKQGLNCERDIMLEHLRMECRANIWRALQTTILALILLVLAFAGGAEASIPSQESFTKVVSDTLPTCAEYLEMDKGLRITGISGVIDRALGAQGVEGTQMTCMLDHVYKIDVTIHQVCFSDPGPWKEIFVRSIALYAPHCGLVVDL